MNNFFKETKKEITEYSQREFTYKGKHLIIFVLALIACAIYFFGFENILLYILCAFATIVMWWVVTEM